jgi:hypothetical protein
MSVGYTRIGEELKHDLNTLKRLRERISVRQTLKQARKRNL